MLYPERGVQMSFMVQALVLLVSGVYYGTDVLPGWLQACSRLAPTTYMLRGIRAAVIDGSRARGPARHALAILAAFGVVMIPGAWPPSRPPSDGRRRRVGSSARVDGPRRPGRPIHARVSPRPGGGLLQCIHQGHLGRLLLGAGLERHDAALAVTPGAARSRC